VERVEVGVRRTADRATGVRDVAGKGEADDSGTAIDRDLVAEGRDEEETEEEEDEQGATEEKKEGE
jgi:hypothetical protein